MKYFFMGVDHPEKNRLFGDKLFFNNYDILKILDKI
jgi:hypothetical protein